MPDVVDVIQSVQVPQLIKDKHISKGKPMLDGRGRPLHYTGGFAVVFPFFVDGEKWAFRCWSADLGNIENRLYKLSKELNKLHLPYFCNFAYEPIGIVVNGQPYPTTRMNWIEGQNIKDYICENRTDSNKIRKLAEDFLEMCRNLHKYKVAHGDLQHGNILVDNSGKLFLIDYDSVYIPALQGESDLISGLPDYQHPRRIDNKIASEKLDYFSELVIYISIQAIAVDPTLLEKYQVEDADRLLFSKEDYLDVENSKVYRDILSLGGQFKELLDVLVEYLKKSDINSLCPFNEKLIENKITFKASSTKAIRSKDSVKVIWQVPFDANVTLKKKDSPIIEKGIQGSIDVVLDEDAEFELTIDFKDGVHLSKRLEIKVYDECDINFKADKEFVFPTLPVVLTWNVTNAHKVWLESEEVELSGSKIVELVSDTIYRLRAQDEFGIKEQRLTVRTIPIKQNRVLLASPPNFTLKQNLNIIQPRFNVSLEFPQINIDWIKVEVPKIKSLTEEGLFQKLSPPLPDVKFNIANSIKKLFNNIIRK